MKRGTETHLPGNRLEGRPAVGRLQKAGVIDRRTAVRRGVDDTGLEGALESVHVRARMGSRGFDPELAVRALGVLAAWSRAAQTRAILPRVERAIVEAERYLTAHYMEPVSIEDLARRLGIAYSHFRRQFREHTGYAPWTYG